MKSQTKKQKLSEISYRKRVLEQRLRKRTFDTGYKYGNSEYYIKKWILPQLSKLKEILNTIGLEKLNNSSILEIGAESGHISSYLCNTFKTQRVICSDIADSLIEAVPFVGSSLGFHLSPTLIILDNYYLPFKDSSFHFVFGFSVLHHFPDPYSILKEVRRVLKIGGIAVFWSEPFLPRYLLPLQFLYSRFDKKQGVCEKVFSLQEWRSFLRDFETLEFQLEPPTVLKNIVPNNIFLCKYCFGGSLGVIVKKKESATS